MRLEWAEVSVGSCPRKMWIFSYRPQPETLTFPLRSLVPVDPQNEFTLLERDRGRLRPPSPMAWADS